MDYRLELLGSDTFEKLVISICQNILGMGVISFSSGKDGGRDGKFVGTAQKYPSEKNPWSGKFIIQAKHTENPIASCSQKQFKEIVEKEIPKIKKLRAKKEVDNYLIFTNRKYTGDKGEELLSQLINKTGVKNSVIIGKETINDLYLKPNKFIIKEFGLDKYLIPIDFSDEEIQRIILGFKNQLPKIEKNLKKKVDQIKYEFNYLEKEEKNKRNNLGKEYYQNVILSRSLMNFSKIRHFLEDPKNEELKNYYFDITVELNQIITIKRDQFDLFEEIFLCLYKLICDSNNILLGSKRHVLTLLHFMYFECDIGKR